jgi:hypothetical protein
MGVRSEKKRRVGEGGRGGQGRGEGWRAGRRNGGRDGGRKGGRGDGEREGSLSLPVSSSRAPTLLSPSPSPSIHFPPVSRRFTPSPLHIDIILCIFTNFYTTVSALSIPDERGRGAEGQGMQGNHRFSPPLRRSACIDCARERARKREGGREGEGGRMEREGGTGGRKSQTGWGVGGWGACVHM